MRPVSSLRITVHPATRFATTNIAILRLIISHAKLLCAVHRATSRGSLGMRSAFRAPRATFNFSPTTLTHFSSRPSTSYRAAFFFNDRRTSGSGRFILRPRSSLQYSVLEASRLARSLARSPPPRGSFVIARLLGHHYS